MSDDILVRDTLGAFCRHTHAAVQGSGRGMLAGLEFAAKDIYDVAGHRTGFGSPDWLRTHPAASTTATAVQQLLDAGADLVGKTHTDELTFSLHGENAHYGTPVNVNAPGRIPGGSSSGSAAAVAGELVAFALGSDTGGSVRAPASFTGVYGMRPTHGRISLEGACALAKSFDTAGWFARAPNIMEQVGAVLLGRACDTGLPQRLLIADDAFELAGHAVTSTLQPAVARMTSLTGQAHHTQVSAEGLRQWFEVFRVLQGREVWAQHGDWIREAQPQLGPGIRQRMEWASTVSARDAESAAAQRIKIVRHMEALLGDHTLLVLPTVPDIAPLCAAPPASTEDFRARALTLLCVAGLAGLPQLSLPLARLNGCPLGISIIGPRDSDMMLLGFARRLVEG